jgi:hypothetical protein
MTSNMVPVHDPMVTRYQAPGTGATIDICRSCEARLRAAREWPRDWHGQEYCQVSISQRPGLCQIDPRDEIGGSIWQWLRD